MVKEPPKTFTDLMKISKDLAAQHTADTAANQFVPFAYNQWDAFWVFPVAHGFGAVEFGPDHKSPALDSDGWVKAYDLLQQLKFTDKLGTDPCDFECADRRFRAGTTAMIFSVDLSLFSAQGQIK